MYWAGCFAPFPKCYEQERQKEDIPGDCPINTQRWNDAQLAEARARGPARGWRSCQEEIAGKQSDQDNAGGRPGSRIGGEKDQLPDVNFGQHD